MIQQNSHFDVIVIGGGHAGCEAAAAAARTGVRTALVTHQIATIGEMSCNPAIGGLGKGHLVREIDALDGVMSRVADAAGIQFRMLNASKGPAVQGPRAQADRALYRTAMQAMLLNYPNLTVIEAAVEDLQLDAHNAIAGVVLADDSVLKCGAVVLTTGTFLDGIIHIGEETRPAGRHGEAPSIGLSRTLKRFEFPMGRLKTGTPPRLDGRTINWDILEVQPGDDPPVPFSTLTSKITTPQVPCYLTYTNQDVHDAIRADIHRAPMYSGQIQSRGPRYCPSIEDKVVRFADKDRHQIFLEPEGLNDPTIYPNGISTSLPRETQDKFVRAMKGLENVVIMRHGYAIEYDYCDPRDLTATLMSRRVAGLFLAGQINGTTGYEEAAAQGLMAGINAAIHTAGGPAFIIDRAEGYLGVMIDDLRTHGAPEPYRMFTSRAEYRLILRADNADQRLTDRGLSIGCVGHERAVAWAEKKQQLEEARTLMLSLNGTPNELNAHGFNINLDGTRRTAHDLLRYQDITFTQLANHWPVLKALSPAIVQQVEIDGRYQGYLTRQNDDIEAYRREENLALPDMVDYASIGGLSAELRLKLGQVKPATLGAASRIPGMTPAALIALLRHVKKKAA